MTERPRRPSRKLSAEDRLLKRIQRNFDHSRHSLGVRRVDCEVSTRWLSFGPESTLLEDGRDMVYLDVMTFDADDDAHKICELIVERGNLERALAAVKTKPFRPRKA